MKSSIFTSCLAMTILIGVASGQPYFVSPQQDYCAPNFQCPTVVSEVCATDGQTYINECFARVAACGSPDLRILHPGSCGLVPKRGLW
uniref:Kazal-type serine proteinase inhibitor n=1 Tax=Macrobrachium nipponense TaxID=159736 RepID=I6QMZ0_MACNP|nr:Kazal-type serine proteinase inhibitor [Macrobrachium nipponense]